MALSGLEIYKLLPKTNCKKCGFATCLAFAMQLAKKAISIDKCPYLSEEAKEALQAQVAAPIKLVEVGTDDNKLEVGNETVMFRHEEKFHHPTGIGFIIDDDSAQGDVEKKIQAAERLKFERIGEVLSLNLLAVRQKKDKLLFVNIVKKVSASTSLPLVLISKDILALREVLPEVQNKRPLVFFTDTKDSAGLSSLAAEFKIPLVVSSDNIDDLSSTCKELVSKGINDIILDTTDKSIRGKLWELTQIRRQALRKNNRSLGFPTLTIVERDDALSEAIIAAVFVLKYSSIVLLSNFEPWEILGLLTLRQNIFTDPQKPLQIEPKLYEVGSVNESSPLLVTTNFSLTYYTVLTEVEASKVPSYILSVDTEGLSVLTAWAAEKFTSETITKALNASAAGSKVSHNELILPGYVAVLSGKLEEDSGWRVKVGPKEASGIPSFLKSLKSA